MSSKGIYWLASYPKSGNTWTRSFIRAMQNFKFMREGKHNLIQEENAENELVHTKDGLVDINALNTGQIASSRHWVEQILGFDTSDLNQEEVDLLRPDAYRWYAKNLPNVHQVHHKIHDAYTYLPDGQPLIPRDATLGALCLVRNPLDVAISFANHSSCSIDVSIGMMRSMNYAFCPSNVTISSQYRQWLLPWSDHVLSWTEAEGIKRLVVRYEDMKQNSVKTFCKIAKFLHLPYADKKTVEIILEEIRIEKFQAQEEKHGFGEKAVGVKSFFRKGIVGDWRDTLTTEQIERIIEDHYPVMQKFGYLDKNKKPTALIMPEK